MPSYTLEPPWLSGPVAPRFVITARDAYDNQVKVNIATEYADTEYRFVMEMFGCKSVPGVSASCPDEMCEDEPLVRRGAALILLSVVLYRVSKLGASVSC